MVIASLIVNFYGVDGAVNFSIKLISQAKVKSEDPSLENETSALPAASIVKLSPLDNVKQTDCP